MDGKIYILKFDGKKNGFGWVLDGTVEDFDSDFADFDGEYSGLNFNGT